MGSTPSGCSGSARVCFDCRHYGLSLRVAMITTNGTGKTASAMAIIMDRPVVGADGLAGGIGVWDLHGSQSCAPGSTPRPLRRGDLSRGRYYEMLGAPALSPGRFR